MKKLLGPICLFAVVAFALQTWNALSDKTETAASNPLEELIGTTLIDSKGNDVPVSSLKDKVIGLYFSASWCGPCVRFTPKLAKYRDQYKDDFEVVLVSSDRSEKAHADYMKKYNMKWPAVKYNAKERKILQQIYQVSGIPKLVLLNSKGDTLTPEGRNFISNNTPVDKIKTARIVEETYKCGKCDKDHVRKKLVYDQDS